MSTRVPSDTASVSLKDFLEDLKNVGRVRIIVNTGMGVLESVTTLEGLFYSEFPGKGEYANLMKSQDNVDFHLLVSKVAKIKLVRGESMRGNIPTYMVRMLTEEGDIGASMMVMWQPGTNGVYDNGQQEAFATLETKYGVEFNVHMPAGANA